MNKLLTVIGVLYATFGLSQNFQMVWSDEFNGNSLDMSKWAFQNGNGCPTLCGWGNGELQTYTENAKNISVSNGVLTMTAVKENVDGSSFTASKLRTLGLHSWKYGRFEARMRMPLGRGMWPAFWMLSTNNQWPTTGEIDIMEYRGDIPKQTFATLHYGQPWPNNLYDGSTYTHSQNLSDDFHLYAVEWSEDKIEWFFDNTLIKTETRSPNSLNPASNSSNVWPWNTEFYFILNFAVGGGFAGSPSVSQVELTKPTFEVDYVRVYSQQSAAPIAIPAKIEAENYHAMYGIQKENTTDTGGGQNVGWIDTGDWLEYKISVETTGPYLIDYRLASLNGGKFKLQLDGQDIHEVVVASTGDWQKWSTLGKSLNLSSSEHTIKLIALQSGWNLNYIEIKKDIQTGLNDNGNDSDLFLYPNPADEQIYFSGLENGFLQIFNANGVEVFEGLVSKESVIDISKFDKGMYFYLINNTFSDKFMVK